MRAEPQASDVSPGRQVVGRPPCSGLTRFPGADTAWPRDVLRPMGGGPSGTLIKAPVADRYWPPLGRELAVTSAKNCCPASLHLVQAEGDDQKRSFQQEVTELLWVASPWDPSPWCDPRWGTTVFLPSRIDFVTGKAVREAVPMPACSPGELPASFLWPLALLAVSLLPQWTL